MTYKEIANSPILWLVTLFAVSIVLLQSSIFMIKSFKAGKEMGMSTSQLKTAIKTGSLAAFGPSVVVVVGMVSLLITVGGPTALMRLAYIGNVVYELLSVGFAADAYGVERTAEAMTPDVFAVALWCMAIGCGGWVVFTGLFTDKLEIIRSKMAGGKKTLIPVISSAAMLGAYGYFNAGYVLSKDGNTVALFSGFIIMFSLTKLYRKYNIKFINEWGLTIAMFSGMILAVVFSTFIGG